jgi:hypothetical protein
VGLRDRIRSSRAQRVTAADKDAASDLLAELNALTAERQRLLDSGIEGVATLVQIREDVDRTNLPWHEFILDVRVPGREPYRASRRVSVELSTAPWLKPGVEVPVRVDRADPSVVLVVLNP